MPNSEFNKLKGKTITIDARSKKVIKKSDPARSSNLAKNKNNQSGVFSGKVLGFTIPGVSPILKNKTFQKVIAGAGLVSVGLSIVQLLNNKRINEIAAKKEVRILAAAAAGDIPGAAFQFFKEDGFKQINLGGSKQTNGAAQQTSMFQQEGLA